MGKALLSLALVGALMTGLPASANAPAAAEKDYSQTVLFNKTLERLYDSVPVKKDGQAIANHLRQIQLAARGQKAPKFEVVMSPTVNQTQVKNSVRAYEQAMTIWQPLGLKKLDLVWVFMSEKDYKWWKARVTKFETENPDTKVWNPETGIIGHCKLSPTSYCGYGNPKPSGKTFQYNVIGSRYTSSPNKNTVNHEAVHFYQDSVDTQLMQKTPCWFVEGQANLIGNVLDDASSLVRNRMNQLNHVTSNIPKSKNFSAKRWLKELKAFDGPKRDLCMQKELSYSVGMFVFESLYSKYSFRQIHELVLETSKSGSFSQAINEVLGTTQETLYKQVASYLAKQF